MRKNLRTKVASLVSKMDDADYFSFSNWIRIPKIKSYILGEVILSYDGIDWLQIEEFYVSISDEIFIQLPTVKLLKQKYLIKFTKGPKIYLIFFDLVRPKVFSLKKNLIVQPDLKDFNSSLSKIPKIIDQSSIFIVKPPSSVNQSNNSSSSFTNNIPLLISSPLIIDMLDNLTTEIYNIELLNNKKLEENNIDLEKFDINGFTVPILTKVDIPGIDELINSTVTSTSFPIEAFTQPEAKFYSPSFSVNVSISKIKIENYKTVVKKVVIKNNSQNTKTYDVLNDTSFIESSRNKIKSLLSKYSQIKWEVYARSLVGFTKHQLESSAFLSQNNYAVLHDELGYEKFDQVASALSYHITKEQIRSVLLVSNKTRFNDYWISSLKKYTKDLSIGIFGITNTFQEDVSSRILLLDVNSIKSTEPINPQDVDIVIFDELVNINPIITFLDNSLINMQPKLVWFLSSELDETFLKKYLDNLSFTHGKDFHYFGKSLLEIQQNSTIDTNKDIWLELDEFQQTEYNATMAQSIDEINKLLENLNPFLFQSNVFKIIHKLKQIINFPSGSITSPKSDILVEQAKAIIRNEKKLVVFTQYEQNGMKKIEKILQLNNLNCIIGKNGMSIDELKESLKLFYESKKNSIFITNLKPSRLELDITKVQYLINFDQWWNPTTIWQNQEELGLSPSQKDPLVVYNYKVKNTIEDRIENLLEIKGITRKFLFEYLKGDTLSELIVIDDWQYIFGLKNDQLKIFKTESDKIYKRLQSIDFSNCKNLVKTLYILLGFNKVSAENITEQEMFYVSGSNTKGTKQIDLYGKFIIKRKVSIDDYQDIIDYNNNKNNETIKMVMTSGDFTEKLSKDIFFINGHDFANLILTLGIKI